MMAMIQATLRGKTCAANHNTPTMIPPVSHPANGHSGTTCLKCSASTCLMRQNGKRVKNINVANILSILKIFRYGSFLKTLHLIDHSYC